MSVYKIVSQDDFFKIGITSYPKNSLSFTQQGDQIIVSDIENDAIIASHFEDFRDANNSGFANAAAVITYLENAGFQILKLEADNININLNEVEALLQTLIDEIQDNVNVLLQQIENNTDEIEPKLDTINTSIGVVNTNLTTIQGILQQIDDNTDTLEASLSQLLIDTALIITRLTSINNTLTTAAADINAILSLTVLMESWLTTINTTLSDVQLQLNQFKFIGDDLKVTLDGESITTGPIKYVEDGVDTTVNLDTTNAGNNKPLPVDIYDFNGQRGTQINPIWIETVENLASESTLDDIRTTVQNIDANTDQIEAKLDQFKFIGDDLKTTLDGETVDVNIVSGSFSIASTGSLSQKGSIAAANTSTSILSVNAKRVEAVLRNDSDKVMVVSTISPVTLDDAIKIYPDEVFYWDKPQHPLYGIWESGVTGYARYEEIYNP